MKSEEQDNAPFIIEGTLSNLHYECGRANLLAQVETHYKRNAVLTGVGAVVGELFGQASNAAMLAMYDGEDTQNFVCLVDDKVVCGQFAGAEQFQENGKIKMVVSRQGAVLYVHAALDPVRELVWIHHPWGTHAEVWANVKLGVWGYIGLMIMITMFAYFGGTGDKTFSEVILWFAIIGAGFVTVMALWAMKDMNAVAGPSTAYFRLLGFAKPESVNLNNFINHLMISKESDARGEDVPKGWYHMSMYQFRDVYSLKAAIAADKVKMLT